MKSTRLYGNIVLHENDNLTTTDSEQLIKENNPLSPSRTS